MIWDLPFCNATFTSCHFRILARWRLSWTHSLSICLGFWACWVQVWCRIADVNFQGKIGIFKECSFWQQMQHVILRKKTVFPSNSNQVSQLLYISIAEIQRFRDRFFFHPRYCSFDRFDEEPSSGVARAERWSYRTVEPWNVAEFPKGGQQLVAWRYRTSDDHLVVLALLMIERFVHTDFASLTQFKTTRESSMFNYTPRNTNIAPPPNF